MPLPMPEPLRPISGLFGEIPGKTKGPPFPESLSPCLGWSASLSWRFLHREIFLSPWHSRIFPWRLLCFPWGKFRGQKSFYPWYSRGQPWEIFVSRATKKPGKGRGRGFLLRPSKVNDKREKGGDILKTGCSLCKRKGVGE